MKKTAAVLSVLFLFASFVYAGPFGFEMGMTVDQVKEACGRRTPQLLKNDYYQVIPNKVHPSFDTYIVCIDKDDGLYFIKAIGPDISSSSYGIEVKSQFNKVKDSLDKNYGDGELLDTLLPGSIWNNAEDWMSGLAHNERYLMCSWQKAQCLKLPENMSSIALAAKTSRSDVGYIVLEYCFTNYIAVKARQQAADDSAL
jgi:hypothetical protein